MAFPDEQKGAETPFSETVSLPYDELPPDYSEQVHHAEPTQAQPSHEVSGEVLTEVAAHDAPYSYSDDWSSSGQPEQTAALTPSPLSLQTAPAVPIRSSAVTSEPSIFDGILGGLLGGRGAPPKPPGPPDEGDEEEEGMSRMSFIEHLEELRKRLILALAGVGVTFVLCLLFSDQLWAIVFEPAGAALRALHVDPNLRQISPMDVFQIFWMKVPILFAVFLSSPWVLYQVWAFIAPGLYKKERRYAVPFVVSSAGLFIGGGLFAYFIAFRFGLEFLLGLGIGKGVLPGVSITEYYDLFVDVMLGVGIVFEIPILLFLLTLMHIASPAFLVRHSRYAILAIVILAAFITPTGDVFNLTLFATPMIILFYVGIFASYILVLRREKRRFPWGTFFKWTTMVLVALIVVSFLVAKYYGYHFVPRWPPFVK
jgi:sec-independent protein translocase protein TatC